MVVISPPLPHAPLEGGLAGRDRYLIRTEDGDSHTLTPNRKVVGALKRCESVLVVEMAGPDSVLRTTRLATGDVPAQTPRHP